MRTNPAEDSLPDVAEMPHLADDEFGQVLDCTTHRAVHADLMIYPHSWRLGPAYRNPTPTHFSSPDAAMAWWRDQRTQILDILQTAADREMHDHVWQLAEPIWGLSRASGHPHDGALSQTLAVESLDYLHRQRATVFHSRVAHSYTDADEHSNADRHATRAVDLARSRPGTDPHAILTALSTRGRALMLAGEPERAIDDLDTALDLSTDLDQPRAQALHLRHLGEALRLIGAHDRALHHLRSSADLLHSIGDDVAHARVLCEIARVQLASHDAAGALHTLRSAAPHYDTAGIPRYTAELHVLQGDAAAATGAHREANEHYTTAKAIYTQAGLRNHAAGVPRL